MDFKDLTNELRAVDYCCRRLIDLNLELEVIAHKLKGLSRYIPDLTPEQAKSPLPMPSGHGLPQSPLVLLEQEARLQQEALYYTRRINECRWMDSLDLDDQNMLMDIFVFGGQYDKVASRYGYTKGGMWKHVRGILCPLLKG